MNIFINIISALGGALFGSWMGYKYTISIFNDRTKKQKAALYEEVLIINEDYINWLKILVNEFNDPLRDSYSGAPFIYMQLIENLVVELSGTDEILSKSQRRLLARLSNKNHELAFFDKKREIHINKWLNDENLEKSEKIKASKTIAFWTAMLLREVIDIIFYTAKFRKNSNNFITDTTIKKIDAVCKYANIDFDKIFWGKVETKWG